MTTPNILVGTPAYGGLCYVNYISSLLQSKVYLSQKGVQIEPCFLQNESLIPRGRNTIVAKFMANPKYTHLLFIDADIKWKPQDIEKLLIRNKDIIGGIYPKKGYMWNKLKNDRLLKRIQDAPTMDADLVAYVKANLMGYVINYGTSPRIEYSTMEVDYIGTGFMMIKRSVIEKMFEKYPETKHIDDVGMLTKDEEKYLYALFDCKIHNNRYLSEDYTFCRRWIDIGGKVHADVSVALTHTGTHAFDGNLLSTLMIDRGKGPEPIIEPVTTKPTEPIVTAKSTEPAKPMEPIVTGGTMASKVYEKTKHKYPTPTNPLHVLTVDNVKSKVTQFISSIPSMEPDEYFGKGIVICSGGRYTTMTHRILGHIRDKLKCMLPIELFYAGEVELNEKQVQEFESTFNNLRCIDATKIKIYPHSVEPRNLQSYIIKPFAVLYSSFAEVLLLDADNIPLQDPSILFDEKVYQQTGALFWGDYWTNWYDIDIHRILNTQVSTKTDIESGQFLINKEKCWKAINLAYYMNSHAYFFYRYLMGDKDTYRLSWELTQTRHYQNNYNPQSLGIHYKRESKFQGTSMLHFDLYGNPLFIHLTLDKDITNINIRHMTVNNKDWKIHPTGKYIIPNSDDYNVVLVPENIRDAINFLGKSYVKN